MFHIATTDKMMFAKKNIMRVKILEKYHGQSRFSYSRSPIRYLILKVKLSLCLIKHHATKT
jgi:hypothetical protein